MANSKLVQDALQSLDDNLTYQLGLWVIGTKLNQKLQAMKQRRNLSQDGTPYSALSTTAHNMNIFYGKLNNQG